MSRRSSVLGTVAAAGLALALVLTPSPATAAAPPNDDVGSSAAVTALPFGDAVAVAEATVEDGEPTETCAPFANTVWYAVTLPDATDVFIDTAGSNYDTAVAVWVGSSFADVELIACNDDTFAGLQAAVGFTADADTTYLVQVGAFFEAPPDAMLTISFGPPPKSTGKPFISSGGIRGRLADAYVEEYDEATMTYSSRGIQLLDGTARSKGARPVSVSQLVISTYEEQYDDADGSFTWTQWYGDAQLEPAQFAIDRRLSDAWVDTDLVMFGETCTDSPTGFECMDLGPIDVTVGATWTGDGPVVRTRDRSSEHFEGARFRYRTNLSSRTAVIDGGATGGMDLDFTGAMGNIVSGADGYWNWVRPGSGFLGGAGPIGMIVDQMAPMSVQVDSSRFRGSYATAFDEQYDEADNSYSYRDVTMTIGESRAHSGRWYSFADVSVYSTTQRFDEATQTVTTEEWFGSGPLGDGFVDRKLDAAEATAEVTLWGYACTSDWEDGSSECVELGESTATVAIDWTGVGPTSSSSYRSDSQFDGQHVRYQGRSTNRSAVANGSVTGGVFDWDLVDTDAGLGRNADGYWSKS